MTEKKTVRKTKEVTTAAEKIVVEKNVTMPAEATALAKELKLDPTVLLGWKVYPDRVVIISENGMKFSKVLNGSESD